jgi:hypothetical protein
MKTIIVTFQPSGEVQIEATGFKGEACTKATAEIEKALGIAGKRQRKGEFYAKETNTIQQGR